VFSSFIFFSFGQFCLWNSLPHEGSLTQGKKGDISVNYKLLYFFIVLYKKKMSTFLFFFVGSEEFSAITTMTFNPFISHKRQRKKAHAIIKNGRNFL
jgi:hypothetical protein